MTSSQLEAFRSRFIKFIGILAALSVVLIGIHYYIFHYFASSIELMLPIWSVYVFHVGIVLVIFSIINYRYSIGKTDVFNSFMVLTFLKMVLAIVFLLPVILSSFENKVPDVLNFFILYFIYLALEVWTVTQLLKQK